MRTFVTCCTFALAIACARPESSTPSLAAYAGRWNVTAKTETGDTTLVTYQLDATADTTGWTITLADRPPIPVRFLAVTSDSIVVEAGPYESVLRPGVQVSTHSAFRLHDGMLMGSTTARYQPAGADSVRRIRSEGTRVQ